MGSSGINAGTMGINRHFKTSKQALNIQTQTPSNPNQTTLQKSIIMKGECGCSGTSSCNCGSSCSCSSCGKYISITYIPLSHAPSILLLSCGRSHDSTRNLISLPSLGFSDLGWRDIVLGMD